MFGKERKRKRAERNAKIEESFEKMTKNFISNVSQNLFVQNFKEKTLLWAENNRKAVFFITVSFLVIIFIVILVNPFDRSRTWKETSSELKLDSVQIPLFESNLGISEFFEIMNIKNEVNVLRKKKVLTAEDTAKISFLYLRLNAIAETYPFTMGDGNSVNLTHEDTLKLNILYNEYKVQKRKTLTLLDSMMITDLYKKLKK